MYRLYIGRLQETDAAHTYYAADSQYMLVFAEEPPRGDFHLVPKQKEDALTHAEKQWLAFCKASVTAEHLKKNEEAYADMLTVFCNAFEEELQKEKRRLSENAKQG